MIYGTYPEGMKGWVDLDGWLYSKMQAITDPLDCNLTESQTHDLLIVTHKSNILTITPPNHLAIKPTYRSEAWTLHYRFTWLHWRRYGYTFIQTPLLPRSRRSTSDRTVLTVHTPWLIQTWQQTFFHILPNVHRFSTFFYWYFWQENCNKTVIKSPNTSQVHQYIPTPHRRLMPPLKRTPMNMHTYFILP